MLRHCKQKPKDAILCPPFDKKDPSRNQNNVIDVRPKMNVWGI